MFQRAYNVRLYPNKQQEVLLGKTFGCCRKVYNCMLEARTKSYEATGTQCWSKPSDFYAEFPFLKEVDSNALTAEVLTLNTAFKNFFERKADGFGFPQFKAKHKDKDSYTSYRTNDNIRIKGRKLRLPKVGFVSFRNYEDIDWSVRDIKHVTVTRSRAGKYYASILVEEAVPKAMPSSESEIGIDLGLKEFCVISDGEAVANPRFLKESETSIADLQRAFSKKQKGSKRREDLRLRIAREHEKVANRRKDFLDKLSTRLLRENQTVAVEDLDVREVAEGDHAKSEHDTAWRMFLNKLQYKADWYGRTIVRVGRWFPSSQLCHCCGFKNTLTKDLNVRSWTCPQCGTSHDRDVNAAINILTEGKKIIAAGTAVKGAGNIDTQREAHRLKAVRSSLINLKGSTMSVCCSDGVFISGEYQPLSQRLLSYGMEAYKDVKKRQRVVMWVFMFYDESAMCPACKQSYSEMFAWFHKYNLFDDPVRCVRTVIEPEPKKNLIYTDLGMNKLPTVVFADEKCRILDILFEFPGTKWLEQYVLPFIQDDGKLA